MFRPENVPVAVDVLVFNEDDKILLIERKNEPHGWALPGGFLERGESLADAALRELREETGIDADLGQQFFAYSHPDRDPRGPVVSVVFIAWAVRGSEPKGGDDAKKAAWCSLDALPPLAFDHEIIISDYMSWRFDGCRPPADR